MFSFLFPGQPSQADPCYDPRRRLWGQEKWTRRREASEYGEKTDRGRQRKDLQNGLVYCKRILYKGCCFVICFLEAMTSWKIPNVVLVINLKSNKKNYLANNLFHFLMLLTFGAVNFCLFLLANYLFVCYQKQKHFSFKQ